MGLSAAECNKALDAIVGRANYTANAAVYAALHTGAPGASGTSNASTHTGRQLVSWAAPSGGSIASSAAVTFTLALSGPETLTHVSYWTASTSGSYLGSAPLNASAAVTNGETFTLSSGGLTQQISDSGTKFTDAIKNAILNAWAGLSTMTALAAVHIKVHTGDPGTSGTSNAATETDRVAATFGTGAASGAISNTAAVEWDPIDGPTAPTQDTISWVTGWTAPTAGVFIFRDDLATARSVSSGDRLTLAIGDIDLTLAETT